MRRILTVAVVLVLNLVLQSSLLWHFEVRGVAPNTAIIIIVSMSLLRGSTEGSICGFFSGMLQDIFFGVTIGYYALFGMLCGFFVGKFNKGFYRENYVLPVFLCAISTMAYESCLFLTGPLFSGATNYFGFLIDFILPEMVYNSVLTVVIYRILFSVNSAIEQREKHKRMLFSIK